MITVAFLHSPGQLFHIIFNMLALWLTGPYLESLFGRVRFLALYLLSAFGGSVALLLLANPNDASEWQGGAVGASGAVFGLFAALFVVNRKLRLETAGIARDDRHQRRDRVHPRLQHLLAGPPRRPGHRFPRRRRPRLRAARSGGRCTRSPACVAMLVVLLALVAVKVAMYPDDFPSSLGADPQASSTGLWMTAV